MTNESTIEAEYDRFAKTRFACAFGGVMLADRATLNAAMAALTPSDEENHADTATWLAHNRWALGALGAVIQLDHLLTATAALFALQHHIGRA